MRLSVRSLSTIALLGTAIAVPAFAQSNAGEAPPLTTYAVCGGKPSQADTDAAHGAYMAGKGSFDEADYTTAINYFKDAYRRDCTKNELLIIIARAYELQQYRREAVHELETYLERVPGASDAEVQKRHIANLKREINEQPVATPPASASSSAPPTTSASPAGSASSGGASAALPLPSASSEPPSADSGRGHTIYPWLVVIGGGIAAGVGGALLGTGVNQVSNAEQVCGSSHVCPTSTAGSSAVSQGNSGRTNEAVGITVGSIGLAAVVGGLVWHFVEPSSGEQNAGVRPAIRPEVGPGYAGVGVGGRF